MRNSRLFLRKQKCAPAVLDARAQFPESTLADLYDPVAMPPVLSKAHAELDRAVDRCYRKEPFKSDRERVEYLFKLYEQLTAPLLPVAGKRGGRAKLTVKMRHVSSEGEK